MGLTQHKHSVRDDPRDRQLLLLRGNIGRPGAGLCPVRGHSNVQGDRTMGIFEKPPRRVPRRAATTSSASTAPREHGFDTVAAIRAMRDGEAKVFFAMGGNFVAATPDTDGRPRRRCAALDLTVHVSTKLNRSHVVTGRTRR